MSAARAFGSYDTVNTGPLALQRKPAQNTKSNFSNRLQVVSSVSHEQHAMEGRTMSYREIDRTLRERLRDALCRRVGTGKSISRQQLAYATRLSDGTINNLMSGNNDPSGRVLMELLTFFDESFANEILEPTGCMVAKFCDRRATALRKIAEGMQELRAMGD